MNYEKYSKRELLQKVEELEALNKELLKEKVHEKNLEFGWKGNLGHWYWNVKTNSVTFNELKVTNLGYTKEEIPEHVSYQFFTEKLHPEDYKKVMDCMMEHMQGKIPAYEVEYRIKAKDGTYRWYYDRGKVMEFDEDGSPLLVAGIVFDISESKKMEEEYYALSVKDPLTNVFNRRYFLEKMKLKIGLFHEDSNAASSPFCVAMVDVDDFKQINDSFNHLYGDLILKKITCCMMGLFHYDTLLARWGGDEFILCLEDCKKSEALEILEKLEKQVNQIKLPNGASVSISIGVAEYQSEITIEALIEKADALLYKSKECGKNCIC